MARGFFSRLLGLHQYLPIGSLLLPHSRITQLCDRRHAQLCVRYLNPGVSTFPEILKIPSITAMNVDVQLALERPWR